MCFRSEQCVPSGDFFLLKVLKVFKVIRVFKDFKVVRDYSFCGREAMISMLAPDHWLIERFS